MHFPSSSFVGLVSLLLSQAIAAPTELNARDLSSFVAAERVIALQGALNNIGPNGSRVAGAGPFVVASPSKVNPDCKYLHLSTRYNKHIL
jgi:glucoamylase